MVDSAKEVDITPAMAEAGVDAYLGFGSSEDLAATNPSLIAKEIFFSMIQSAGEFPAEASRRAPKLYR